MNIDIGFSFDDGNSKLVPIAEDEVEDEEKDSPSQTSSSALARKVRDEMDEMEKLLSKLKTDTATKADIDRLKSLNGKLSKFKKEAESAEHDEVIKLRTITTKKTAELRKAAKERQIRSVTNMVCKSEQVDLAFLLDCTGSMRSYIKGVKDSIKKILARIRSTNCNLKLRLAMVGYRDIKDTKRFEVLNFTNSVPTFEAFVNSLAATGGADGPEDIAGAVQQANLLDWSHSTRIAFLIADAPCHGYEFHGGISGRDDYPSGTPGINIMGELRTLSMRHTTDGTMSLFFGRVTKRTSKMIEKFKEGGVVFDVVDLEDASKISAAVTKSVRSSIFKTMTTVSSGSTMEAVAFSRVDDVEAMLKKGPRLSGSDVKLKDFRIHTVIPSKKDWRGLLTTEVKVYGNEKIKSLSELKEPLAISLVKPLAIRMAKVFRMDLWTGKTKKGHMLMRRATHPFAEGEIRIAYHAQLSQTRASLHDKKSAIVLKSFKHTGMGVHDRQQYFQQMEVSNIAHFLSELYNKSKRPGHCAAIHFLQVCLVEDESVHEESDEARFCAEHYLPTGGSDFTKYNNNTGYWDMDKIDESLVLFSEWTFSITNGYLMITDLQGVKCKNRFILTDPVVLCTDIERFGHTNLGPKLMEKCVGSIRAIKEEKAWK